MRAAVLVFAALALTASVGDAKVNCRTACARQIRKCIKACCTPPAFDVPRRACIQGIRGAALYACKLEGKRACPKKACVITDC
jgi:hypothetical protein